MGGRALGRGPVFPTAETHDPHGGALIQAACRLKLRASEWVLIAFFAYIAAVAPLLGNEQAEHAAFRIKRAVPWREAPLFVERGERGD